MIKEFLREIISWLGYLQRGSVLIQIILFVAVVLIDKRYKRPRQSQFPPGVTALIAPFSLLVVSIISMLAGFPGGFLRYLSASWLAWRKGACIMQLLPGSFAITAAKQQEKAGCRPHHDG